MHLTRRIKLQLAIFTVIAMAAAAFMLFGYLNLPALAFGAGRYTVTLQLPETGGLYKSGNVTYHGTEVGRVSDVHLEVSYVPDDGAVHRMPLARAWEMPLERSLPVRRFTSRKGQRHLSGLWWSATTGGHVGFESWLET